MKRFIIKIMEFLTLFYAVMLVGTIIVDQLAVPYFIPVKKYIFRGLVIIAFVLVFIEMVIDLSLKVNWILKYADTFGYWEVLTRSFCCLKCFTVFT